MAGAISWFANSAALTMTVEGTATACTVGALKNVTFTPKFEIATLYGMESLLPQARCKHTFVVDVKCEYAMWDPTADTIMSSFLQGNYSTLGAGVNDAAGQRQRCATFNITAVIKDSGSATLTAGASTMTLVAKSVVFPEIPMELRENEYITRNLAGTGTDMTITYG